jgi:hypothetical protein
MRHHGQSPLSLATTLVIAYHLIQRKEPYRGMGGNYFDRRRPKATARRLVKRLEQLGYAWLVPDRRIEENLDQ